MMNSANVQRRCAAGVEERFDVYDAYSLSAAPTDLRSLLTMTRSYGFTQLTMMMTRAW
jgi:hypothetical protein